MSKSGAYHTPNFDPLVEIERRTMWLQDTRTDEFAAELDGLGLPDGAHVVDLGCGIGQRTLLTAQHKAVGHVVGVDTHRELVQWAAGHAAEQGVHNVAFRLADAAGTGLESSAYDLVRIDSVLWAVPNPITLLAEALRLLRPGGRLLVYNHDATASRHLHFPPVPEEVARVYSAMDEAFAQWGSDQFIGHKLYSYVVRAKFADVRVAPEVRVSCGPLSKRDQNMHWQFIDQWLPDLLGQGWLTEQELNRAKAVYPAWAARADRFSSRLLFRVTARKPGRSKAAGSGV